MGRRHFGISLLCGLLLTLSVTSLSAYSTQKEIQLGIQASKDVEKEMPLSDNQRWQTDIQTLGNRLVPFVRRKDIPYHFRVVKAKDEINAFAIPGGYVYFTERMWSIMTPDERAAIMAHEITHCDQRHGIDMMLKSQQRMLWMLPVVIATGGSAGVLQAAIWGNVAIAQRYSRKMEREADESGIQLLAAAGFDTAGTVTSMKKLLYIESDMNRYEISSVFASHPDTLERVQYLSDAATRLGANPNTLELKAVQAPDCIGNIISKRPEANIVHCRTEVPLLYGQRVVVKKLMWDDDLQALAPKTVATAKALTPGRLPILILDKRDELRYAEIMTGDGIYLMTDPTIDPFPKPAISTPPDAKPSLDF